MTIPGAPSPSPTKGFRSRTWLGFVGLVLDVDVAGARCTVCPSTREVRWDLTLRAFWLIQHKVVLGCQAGQLASTMISLCPTVNVGFATHTQSDDFVRRIILRLVQNHSNTTGDADRVQRIGPLYRLLIQAPSVCTVVKLAKSMSNTGHFFLCPSGFAKIVFVEADRCWISLHGSAINRIEG